MPRRKHEIPRKKLIEYADNNLSLPEIAKIEGRGVEVIRSRYREAGLPHFKKVIHKVRARKESKRVEENEMPLSGFLSTDCQQIIRGPWF